MANGPGGSDGDVSGPGNCWRAWALHETALPWDEERLDAPTPRRADIRRQAR